MTNTIYTIGMVLNTAAFVMISIVLYKLIKKNKIKIRQ